MLNAVGVGGLVALAAALIILGSRTDMRGGEVIAWVIAKLVFAGVVTVLAFFYLIRLARPGKHWSGCMALVALPFVGIGVLASMSLALAPASHWKTTILDDQWLECHLSITLIAMVPFALVTRPMREAAPTNLRRAGVLTGLIAGGLSAAGYALHCTADLVPFVAI